MKNIKSLFFLTAFAAITMMSFGKSNPVAADNVKSPITHVVHVDAAINNVAVADVVAMDSVNANENTSLANAGWIIVLALSLVPLSQGRFTRSAFGFNAYFGEMDVMPFTVAQKALWDYLMSNDGDVNTQNALRNKDLLIVSYAESLKFQVPISSANKIELLNPTAAYRQGRIPQEYNQGYLPKGFNIAVSKVRLAYGTDAALLPEAITNYTTVPASWPAGLQHGQVIISQNNTPKEQFSGRAAGSAAASFGSGIDSDGYEFQSPMILEEGKPIKIELYCPTAVPFPATPAILAVAVEFIGACVRPRS